MTTFSLHFTPVFCDRRDGSKSCDLMIAGHSVGALVQERGGHIDATIGVDDLFVMDRYDSFTAARMAIREQWHAMSIANRARVLLDCKVSALRELAIDYHSGNLCSC